MSDIEKSAPKKKIHYRHGSRSERIRDDRLHSCMDELRSVKSELAKANERVKELEMICLNSKVVDLVRCGIGSNYGGSRYEKAMAEIYEPIKQLRKEQE